MMKNILYVLVLLFLIQCGVSANSNDVYVADIQYDWINKSEVEREDMINEVREIIFLGREKLPNEDSVKTLRKGKNKDKNHIENYMAASAGYKEFKDNNISAFYMKNKKYIYMYAIQDKKDLSKAYYYDALGHLQYIDYIEGEFPEYPYYCIQYRTSGKPVSAVYYVSKDTQYMYEPNGKFKGLWYKYNMYDKHSKVILKRTSY